MVLAWRLTFFITGEGTAGILANNLALAKSGSITEVVLVNKFSVEFRVSVDSCVKKVLIDVVGSLKKKRTDFQEIFLVSSDFLHGSGSFHGNL